MSQYKRSNRGRLVLFIGIPAVLLLIAFRFLLYYFKSDGLSGLSISLPLLMAGTIISAVLTAAFFAAWVYQDCKTRNDDGILWAMIVVVTTPFIGLLVYFLRRSEQKQACPACKHRISLQAIYCEACGTRIEQKEETNRMKKQYTHHLKYIVSGTLCMALMLLCLTGFIISAATAGNMNTIITSDEKVWNIGSIHMNYNTHINGVWKLDFNSASKGFVAQEDMQIEDAATEFLYGDISCSTVPAGASLILWLVQGSVAKSIDVTNLSTPLAYALSEFEAGPIHVRLQINGVENTTSELSIQAK